MLLNCLNNSVFYITCVNIDNLVSMFTQKSGLQQSVATTIITLVMQYVMQQLGGGGTKVGLAGITSVLSELGTNLNADNPLVKQIQEKIKIEDPQKVTQYTQQAVELIKQEASANPKGIESLFSNVLGNVVGETGGDVKKSIGDRIKGLFVQCFSKK
jgi:hypothetical protein